MGIMLGASLIICCHGFMAAARKPRDTGRRAASPSFAHYLLGKTLNILTCTYNLQNKHNKKRELCTLCLS
jgi:hypothetical protein